MSNEIAMVHATFRDATADVRRAADRLERDRTRIDNQVTGFLDDGWTGVAAEAFTEAWGEWREAAADVWRGLDALHQLLGATQADFIEGDEESQAALDRVSARLIDRLGADS